MSRDASLTTDFGNDKYTFRLAWGQLSGLQESCDAGPYVVLDRLVNGTWKMNDIRETIRYGLIGGGVIPPTALSLVREYVESRPPMENVLLARAVLTAGLMGAPEEKVGEDEAANQGIQSMTSPMEKSDLPPSTETQPQ